MSLLSLARTSSMLQTQTTQHVARSAIVACRHMSSGAAAAQPAEARPQAAAPASAAASPSSAPRLRIGASTNRVSYSVPKIRASALAAAQAQSAAPPSYPLDVAVGLVRACAHAAFDETVELAIRLNLDPRKPNQSVRGAASLPHGTGKSVRVAVFARGEKAQEALAAGADIVGEKDLVDQILAGKLDFDRCIATPDLMSFVGRVARILGPRGLMPNPKVGSVTMDVGAAVKSAKQGSVEFKTDKTGVVHVPVGKVSFSRKQLAGNIESFVERIVEMKPSGAPKGAYIVSAHLASSMGPGVPLDMRAEPFKGSVLSASSASGSASSDVRSGLAAMGAYGRMHSVNGFDVVRYDLGPHPSEAEVAQAKGKWPMVKEQIKQSRKEGHSWKVALEKVDAINKSAPLPPKTPAAGAKGAKPNTPVPSTFGKEAAAKAPKAAKPAKE